MIMALLRQAVTEQDMPSIEKLSKETEFKQICEELATKYWRTRWASNSLIHNLTGIGLKEIAVLRSPRDLREADIGDRVSLEGARTVLRIVDKLLETKREFNPAKEYNINMEVKKL